MLRTITYGNATDRPPLLIAHGLFGSARNWGVIAKRLADTRTVLCVDMRNHGESAWRPEHGYPDLAADLAEVIGAHGGRVDILGHSMGGKAAMQLALTHGDLVDRLIVADIAPVAYGHSQSHLIDAMRGLPLADIATRGEADKLLSDSVESVGVRAFLLQSLDLKTDPPHWRLNLDVLDAEMDQITGWPDNTARSFAGPVLFLSGEQSDYVQPAHRNQIKALFPRARFARIPDAGHWLHAENPRAFEATVRVFLDAGTNQDEPG